MAFFPYRAPGDDRLGYSVESLTLYQIRDALAAYLAALPLGREARRHILEHAAWTISYERHRNERAKTSHRKAALRRLRKLGIYITRIRTCLASNFAL